MLWRQRQAGRFGEYGLVLASVMLAEGKSPLGSEYVGQGMERTTPLQRTLRWTWSMELLFSQMGVIVTWEVTA